MKLRIYFNQYRMEWANLKLWNGYVIRKVSKVAADLIVLKIEGGREAENGLIPLYITIL